MCENEIDLVRATSSHEDYVCNMAMVDTYMCRQMALATGENNPAPEPSISPVLKPVS